MRKDLPNYYEALALHSSASHEEIRRAYRILARRYHPDVNPGKASEEKFKFIAEAYSILSDNEKRSQYDVEYHFQLKSKTNPKIREYQKRQREKPTARQRYEAFEKMREAAEGGQRRSHHTKKSEPIISFGSIAKKFSEIKNSVFKTPERPTQKRPQSDKRDSTTKIGVNKVSILEISISMKDAIRGVRKAVELSEPEGQRKISVNIPPGVRTGSVLRFRDKGGTGEELVFIIRVASHPFLSMENKGLIVEVPISVGEAFLGASLTLPTLEEPVVVKVPPFTQSGVEIRIRGKGIQGREGERGDLFYRLMIKLPEAQHAVGLQEKVGELERYYPGSVRQVFPKSVLEFE